MTDLDPTEPDLARRQDLTRMKRFATGLLLVVTGIYILTRIFHGALPWLGYLEATMEAAMVGAIADWFAVTALFRHPLGLKIPHTAIIPNRKDQIAAQFGTFVQQNFLSEDVIAEKIRAMNLSHQVAQWIVTPSNAEAVAEQMTAGLAGAVRVMNDTDIQTLIEEKVANRIRETSFSPLIGELLTFLTSGRRQQEAIDVGVRIALGLLADSDDQLRETVNAETPWWFPSTLDKAVYKKLVRSFSKTLYEMQVDIFHPMRVRIVRMTTQFMQDLKYSEDIAHKEAAIKEDLLNQPALRDFTGSLWTDIKAALLDQSENPNAELKQTIQRAVIRFGESVLDDPALAAKIDGWAQDGGRYLIRTYGHEVARLIASTIESWDPEATAERIEIQIGKDLQFIRINGTVVGGLAGLSIHTLSELKLMSGINVQDLWPF
ncbi:MAG: uncharacterized membrane-anchored protein YjiN (DUF445 family) [Urechidicola sp.]|jgi:uncharacterized membrane-anchored protein YjiN (DUF445 family)